MNLLKALSDSGADKLRAMDREFYESYDPDIVRAKCLVLYNTIEHFDEATTFFTPFGLELEAQDKTRLSADLYFSEFQLFEALFALLLAVFQSEPHWIYVSRYQSNPLRGYARSFTTGDVGAITSGLVTSKLDFVRVALYNQLEMGEDKEAWATSLENILWLLDRLMQKYADAVEYNAFKHGVRVFAHASEFGITSRDESVQSWKWASDTSVRFLELTGIRDGEYVVRESVRQFDLEESMAHIEIMYQMLVTIKETRLARLMGKDKATILLLPELDKTHLSKLRTRDFKFSLTLGTYSRA